MSDLRYPIGKFSTEGVALAAERAHFIEQIERAPAELRAAVQGLSPEQLDTPYRPDRVDGAAGGASCSRQPHE